ncbi:hypothetical protein INT44_004525 [Umbelopsis vinacea]|uniref:Uncharacterized protein n=1 Tax=Umbelopsis vinacea TaxID=44442 RepID=A0A8H7URH8_9FUNG|nr:hypothetical protein INT44_004525 [Umbelopsis vinacea]
MVHSNLLLLSTTNTRAQSLIQLGIDDYSPSLELAGAGFIAVDVYALLGDSHKTFSSFRIVSSRKELARAAYYCSMIGETLQVLSLNALMCTASFISVSMRQLLNKSVGLGGFYTKVLALQKKVISVHFECHSSKDLHTDKLNTNEKLQLRLCGLLTENVKEWTSFARNSKAHAANMEANMVLTDEKRLSRAGSDEKSVLNWQEWTSLKPIA